MVEITKRPKDEEELYETAREHCHTLVERRYDAGNSSDVRRTAEPAECGIIADVIYGALLSIRGNYATPKQAADTAEFIADALFRQNQRSDDVRVNCYDTIYIPIINEGIKLVGNGE
jgi:hypothetical protein